MRRRSVWYRSLIALWGMWLAVALCEPMELHACPMHDAMAMAGMQMPGMAMGAEDQAAVQEQGRPAFAAVCTCVTCCGATNVAAPEAGSSLSLDAPHTSQCPLGAGSAGPRIQRAHALPFGTAPPAAVSLI